jgi:hypothetical protein
MPGPGCAWSEALVPRSRYVRGKPSSSAAAGPVVVDRSRPVGRLIYERLRAICSAGEVRSSRAAPCHRGAPAPPRSSVRSCAAPRTLVAMCSPPDYLGAPDPFAVLHAAAQLAQRMRLRTYVLNVGFLEPGAASPGLSDHGPALRRAARARTRRRAHAKRARRRWCVVAPPSCPRRSNGAHPHGGPTAGLSPRSREPRPAQSRIRLAVGATTSSGLGVAAPG